MAISERSILQSSLHHMKVSSAVMEGWCIAVALLPTSAIAGPPFRTDDPEPVDYTHWEFYTFTSGTHISGDTSGVGAAFEFNYGLIPCGQNIGLRLLSLRSRI